MRRFEFRACASEDEVAATAAGWVLDAFVGSGGDFGIGVSGGRVAPVFFRESVRQARGRGLAFGDADFFWCDERCVPAEHEQSNYRVTALELLEPLGVAPGKVHRLRGELPPASGAVAAREDWERWRAGRVSRGKPGALDVAVLGVGEDGHVASLFPENLETDLRATEAYRAVRGSKPPPDRLTLGYRELWEAARVVVLATGSGKEAVVRGSWE
ncbi:MAG: 6-phosphogluconolactonase, partial [Verrucomicrobiales bacterium]|nr:6-phosphogluconolactonase [Verrucomicrobiales bacterium]